MAQMQLIARSPGLASDPTYVLPYSMILDECHDVAVPVSASAVPVRFNARRKREAALHGADASLRGAPRDFQLHAVQGVHMSCDWKCAATLSE